MARNGCSAAALVAEFRWTAPFPSTLALLLLLLLVNVNVEAVYNTQCSAVTECMCVSVYKIHEVASDWCSTHTTAQAGRRPSLPGNWSRKTAERRQQGNLFAPSSNYWLVTVTLPEKQSFWDCVCVQYDWEGLC